MFRSILRKELQSVVSSVIAAGDITGAKTSVDAFAELKLPSIEVEVPRDRQRGDYATNVAMLLAKQTDANPRDVAQRLISAYVTSPDRIARLEVAGPGFINITIAWPWKRELVSRIRRLGKRYGQHTIGAGRRVNVEFVSANPTGPLHVGTGRGAVIGDVLANLLSALKFDVSREYYINDAGQQVRNLALSVEAHYRGLLGERGLPFPVDGYAGDYVRELARGIMMTDGDKWLQATDEERLKHFREVSVAAIVDDIRNVLERFGVQFDKWFSERNMVASGEVNHVLAELRARGYVYEKEGKVWFRAADLGDEKDRVIYRPDGGWTYFGSDVAYHLNKLARGFEVMIDVWAIDHIGAVSRLRAGLRALGIPDDTLEILVHQHVRLKNEGEVLRIEKRKGEFVTLRELLDAVNVDAARFFYAMFSPSVPMDFDIELARKHSQDNPVYYVQYAHARIAGILREARLLGDGHRAAARRTATAEVPLDRLEHEQEAALIHVLAELPEVIRAAGVRREPHRLCTYAREVAEAFHQFYTHCRVLTDDASLTAARLALVDATRIVLRRTLGLLGVSAPDRM